MAGALNQKGDGEKGKCDWRNVRGRLWMRFVRSTVEEMIGQFVHESTENATNNLSIHNTHTEFAE